MVLHPGSVGRLPLLAAALTLITATLVPGQSASFQRGDSNRDGIADLSDPINLLGYLFLGSPSSLGCDDAADANDSGDLDLSDAVYALSFLFSGGAGFPPPGTSCGIDPTADDLACDSYAACTPCDDTLVPRDEGCPGDVFTPDSPIEEWNNIRSALVVSLGPPRHRALDVVAGPGDEQIIIGKFAYGPLDRSLEGETVEVWLRRACGEWVKLGSALTSEAGEHAPVQGVEDDGGRIFFTVPAAQRPGPGRYAVKLLVKGDHSSADGSLHVWPPGRRAVVADIDGALTNEEPPDEWSAFDALAASSRVGAAAAFQAYAAKGIRTVYLSARPERLAADTRLWLDANGFPPGVVRLSLLAGAPETAPASVAERGDVIARLVSEAEVSILTAYGTTPQDRAAYLAGGVPAASIALLGFDGSPDGARAFESWSGEEAIAICLPSSP